LAHHTYSFVPRHAGQPLDRLAVAAADRFWNALPLRILTDGRFHAPLGHGEYLPELAGSLDFLVLTPAPRTTVAFTPRWVFDTVAAPGDRPDEAAVHALAELHPRLAGALRRVAALGTPVMITTARESEHSTSGAGSNLDDRLAAIERARESGADVRGLLYAPFVDDAPFVDAPAQARAGSAGRDAPDASGAPGAGPGGIRMG
jgi:hypothetical protein